ncbi:hypothetical protein ABE10_03090, partial [Bacillus toyonensis]|nr:hypothetical protein [Bacillus toyonensis]
DPGFEALAALDSRVTLHRSEANRGFAGGVNRLAAALDGADDDILWVLNPDTRVVPGCVQALTDCLSRHPDAIISPVLLRPDGTIWYAGGAFEPKRGYSAHDHYGESPEVLGTAVFPTQFVTGAALTLTKRTWSEVGPLREDLFLYWEDTDLSLRAATRGTPLLVVPGAVVEHLEGGSSSGGKGRSAVYYYYFSRNRIIVCAPTAGLLQLIVGRGIIETVRALAKPLIKERDGRWKKTFASFRGLWAGIRAYRASTTSR